MAKQIVMEGFSLPNGITTEAGGREMQRKNGTTVDGVWGPKTQNAYDKFLVQQAKGWQNAPTSKRVASKGEVDYAKTIYGLSLGVGKSDAGSHVMAGYQTPAGVNTADDSCRQTVGFYFYNLLSPFYVGCGSSRFHKLTHTAVQVKNKHIKSCKGLLVGL